MYKKLLTDIILQVTSNLEKPSFIYSEELCRQVKEKWQMKGIEITPDKIGNIMRSLGFSPHTDGKKRGWIIV